MKIVLVGYMASGKSAVGLALSRKLNLSFIDLDNYIEENEKKTIKEIYFRKIESKYLEELLARTSNFILSLGGGTPCYGKNMELVKEHALSYYLRTSINTIYKRLLSEKDKRPLIAEIPNEELQEFIGKHLFERIYFYEQSSQSVNTDNKTVAQIVAELSEN